MGDELVQAVETLPTSATVTVDYKYDVYGNLIERTQYSGTTLVSDQDFGYDGWTTNLDAQGNSPGYTGNENFNVWATIDNTTATLQSRQVFGNSVDSIQAQIVPGSSAIDWYATDYQGSVRAVLDDSGTVINTVTYDGFGTALQTSALGEFRVPLRWRPR